MKDLMETTRQAILKITELSLSALNIGSLLISFTYGEKFNDSKLASVPDIYLIL